MISGCNVNKLHAIIQHQHLHLNVTSVNRSLKYMKKVLTFVLLIKTLEET